MHVCSDDYIVIARYSAPDHDWLSWVDTAEKRENLIEFSLEVARIFIGIGACVSNADKSNQGGSN